MPPVNVEGYLDTCAGQGEAARLYLRALRSVGVPVTASVIDVETVAPDATVTLPRQPDVDWQATGPGIEPSVNLICVNGLELPAFAAIKGRDYFSRRRSVGVWAWETDRVPDAMARAADLLEEIWVYSGYVARNLGPTVPVPVEPVPLPVVAPTASGGIGIDLPDGFTFLFMFDFLSTMGRKNPLGVLDAFSRAFEPGEGPQLVFKTVNGAQRPDELWRVREAIGDRRDVHVIDRVMGSEEKAALFSRIDCYVSLHRSEGFGLPIAEAMALGKPAIATGHSGNREFMTPDNSYLVDYAMTSVGDGNDVYPSDGRWAEPDVEHAASLMRHVWQNQDEASDVGERARRELAEDFSPEAIGARARRRLEELMASPRRAPTDDATGNGEDGPRAARSRGALSRLLRPLRRRRELRHAAASVPVWFHSIDLGGGVVTPGMKTAGQLASELEALRLPDLRGKTVLDVGAWDGFYSFEAERRGAARVVALDHYAWSIDLAAWNGYLADCRERGETPRPADEVPGVWRPDELAGKSGFDLAAEALGSNVEPLVGDFMRMDPAEIGSFDVVLFLGVLYHLKDPLGGLERLASVTRDLAIVESEADVVPGREDEKLCRFLEADERAGDPGNWWSPNLAALLAMCRAAGFAHAEAVAGPPPMAVDEQHEPLRYRAVVHARK